MASVNNNTSQQVYNIREDEDLLSSVASIACVLMQRGLWVAGYSDSGEVLTIHTYSYNNNKAVWELDLFEHLFANEGLFAAKDKVKAAFICSSRNMIVPAELYNEKEAMEWFRRIHLTESGDEIGAVDFGKEESKYLMAVPMGIPALVKIHFKQAAILPLPLYHFANPGAGQHLHCTLMPGQAIISLHYNRNLQWHHMIDYTSAEDVAYAIKHYFRENNIDAGAATIVCDAASGAEFDIIRELYRYFPALDTGDGSSINARWGGAVSLANQLLACV
ncbi:MAG: DUF3822 family protein [Bacteroidota bacterium]